MLRVSDPHTCFKSYILFLRIYSVRMYISQLEIMRFKARSEGREEDFKSCWYDYRVLMRRRGDGHLVPVRDVEVEYYREKIVWDLMCM